MLNRSHRTQEALVRYWSEQAVVLCRDLDSDDFLQPYADTVQQAIRAMEHDRRVVFIGGKGCGKTALLAAVTGCPVMAKVPLEGPYVCWRYRCDDGDPTLSRFLPEESLEGLELVDTADCGEEQVAGTVKALLPGADVVVAVVDARHPAESPVWPLLAEAQDYGTAVIALTYTDKLGADALMQLSDDIRTLCRSRLQVLPAAYNVSPTSEAAVDSFTIRLQDALGAPEGVRRDIRRVQEAAIDLMYKQGSVLKTREDVSRSDSGFLSGIEQEIENFQTRQQQGVSACRDNYTDALRRTRPLLLRALRRSFGWWFSPVTLIRLEHFGIGVKRRYIALVQEDVCHLQEESDRNFMLSCAAHWRSVRPRMKQTLDCEIGEFPEAALGAELGKLRTQLALDLNRPFTELKIGPQLAGLFRTPIGWMRAAHTLLCIVLMLAGIMGFMGQYSLALIFAGTAGGLWIAASLLHIVTSYRLQKEVERRTEGLCDRMRQFLTPVVQELIISRIAAYRRLYTVPRRKVAEHEENLQPLQTRHNNIYRSLRAAVQRL